MARKKNVEIKYEELTPTVLGELDSRGRGFLPLIFIFIILISFLYFLPELTERYEVYQDGGDPFAPLPEEENKYDNSDDETVNVTEKIAYTPNMELSEKDELFKLENIVITNGILSLTVTNLQTKEIDMNAYDYYVEVYREETLLTRNSLDHFILKASSSFDITYESENDLPTHIRLISIKESDYPEVTLNYDEEGFDTISCTKDYLSVDFDFDVNGLTTINEYVRFDSTEENYDETFIKYNELSVNLNKYVGVITSFEPTSTNFTYRSSFTMKDVTGNNIPEFEYSFEYEDSPNKVKFINEVWGYTCK